MTNLISGTSLLQKMIGESFCRDPPMTEEEIHLADTRWTFAVGGEELGVFLLLSFRLLWKSLTL